MSPLGSNTKSGGPYRKPRPNLYTVLLILSLVAIVLGIICLHFEMKMYDYRFKDFKGAPRAAVGQSATFAFTGDQRPAPGGYGPAVFARLAAPLSLIPVP